MDDAAKFELDPSDKAKISSFMTKTEDVASTARPLLVALTDGPGHMLSVCLFLAAACTMVVNRQQPEKTMDKSCQEMRELFNWYLEIMRDRMEQAKPTPQ